MTRYDQPTPVQLAVLNSFGRTTSATPIPRATVMARNPEIPPHQVEVALADLYQGRFLSTLSQTRDGITQDVFWPTGLKPITPPTEEELKIMSTPKNLWLLQTIIKHPGQTAAQLSAMAGNVGINIPSKNVNGLLASYIQSDEVIKDRNDTKTIVYRPGVTKEAPATPAGPDLMAEIEGLRATLTAQAERHADELSRAEADLKTESDRATALATDLADICRALDAPHAGEAIAAIEHLERLADAKTAFGRLALLLIDSADLIQIEELDPYDAANAQQLAVRNIEHGNAARAVVVNIIGEAKRQVEWKAAA